LVSVHCAEADEIETLWPEAEPHIKNAFRRGGGDFEETKSAVLNGEALLWFASAGDDVVALAVTQVCIEGDRRICHILALVGLTPAREWMHRLVDLENYARAMDCTAMRLRGRKGWMRMLPDYRQPYVTLEKDLS